MSNLVKAILILLVSISIFSGTSNAYELSYTVKDAQRIIDENFEPKDCGKVTTLYNRKGGGQSLICSNGETYMLAQIKGKSLAMRCSVLDKYKVQGIDLGVTTSQCMGR